MLAAGTARVDITPPIGIAHAGWGAQSHEGAEGVDMPLTITALVIEPDGNTNPAERIAILDIDTCILVETYDVRIRNAVTEATGIPAVNQRVSYTHTHSGPIEGLSWIVKGADMVEPWFRSLAPASAKAVEEAISKIVPVRSDSGKGHCEININRRPVSHDGKVFTGRNASGFVDHEVLVTALDDLDGNPVATLVNYACHPTIMGPENKLITPDYPGPVRETVESIVGGTCLFLQGAAGNQGPIDGFTGDTSVYRKLGKQLGIEAARVRLTIDPVPREEKLEQILSSGADLGIYSFNQAGESDDTLGLIESSALLPIKEMPPESEVQANFDAIQANLENVRKRGGTVEEIKQAAFPAKRETLLLRHTKTFGQGGEKREIPIQVIRIGNTALVAIPVEPFAEIGTAVKERSPADWTLFSGYANGYYGYLPMEYAYPEGGYEVGPTAPFEAGAAEQMIEDCLEAIHKLWD
ncbi:MAG: neutral/alkaline non-lysosomal ceramidase N-terminal domain-containing protein [Chloroflexi bacterium]|nr:neutral/alkaline non-lysosomal ceramidase N-terminal domain-containing protein [Chloroflexota bacterium]MDA1281596.1 neutral/alkaline non-lysosomal ceramidase N-terminal domain-containing protein [Chloroflexota bacterium]